MVLKIVGIVIIAAISKMCYTLAKDEDVDLLKKIVLVSCCIILDIIGVSELRKVLFGTNTNVPENEQGYHLATDVPDEEIEVNGHKYILADE
ncbi:MAG: hypothetical protein J6A37_11500 [Oscillospiraceae bacterium]|nr:hypothetical protein [Oscillospiraceae bacterium]